MAITKKFWLFDAGTGSAILEEDAAEFFKQWRNTGVLPAAVHDDWELEVVGDDTGMQVKVKPGTINIEGYWFKMAGIVSDREVITIAANVSGNPRIDRIVAYVHPDNNDMDVKVVEGTPAGSPSAPALVQDLDDEWQESLALVAVANGEASIESGHVTDDRSYSYPDFDPGATVLPTQISPQGSGSNLDADSVDGWDPGSLLLTEGSEVTLSGGAVTVDPDGSGYGVIDVDTEADAAFDNFDTMTFTTPVDGYVMIVRPAHDDRTIIVTDSGNFKTPANEDIYLMGTEDHLIVRWNNADTKWETIGGTYALHWGVTLELGIGTSNIVVGTQFAIELPWDGEIHWHRIMSKVAATVQFDAWLDSYANWPPTVADTIYGTKPALTAATKAESTAVATAFSKGDWLMINCDSNTDATQIMLAFGGVRRQI